MYTFGSGIEKFELLLENDTKKKSLMTNIEYSNNTVLMSIDKTLSMVEEFDRYLNNSIGTEGILGSIWEGLKNFVDRVIEFIKSIFRTVKGWIFGDNTKSEASAAVAKVEERKKNPAKDLVEAIEKEHKNFIKQMINIEKAQNEQMKEGLKNVDLAGKRAWEAVKRVSETSKPNSTDKVIEVVATVVDDLEKKQEISNETRNSIISASKKVAEKIKGKRYKLLKFDTYKYLTFILKQLAESLKKLDIYKFNDEKFISNPDNLKALADRVYTSSNDKYLNELMDYTKDDKLEIFTVDDLVFKMDILDKYVKYIKSIENEVEQIGKQILESEQSATQRLEAINKLITKFESTNTENNRESKTYYAYLRSISTFFAKTIGNVVKCFAKYRKITKFILRVANKPIEI